MLTCPRVRALLEDYVDGDLAAQDPSTAEQVRAHLATCEECRAQYEQAVSLPFRLRALRAPAPPSELLTNVMSAVRPARAAARRAWTLLLPEALLVTFIVWYLSGLQGLASLASGTLDDLGLLLNWGIGGTTLPSVPVADVFLLIALIALAVIAAYHVSVLASLDESDGRSEQAQPYRRHHQA
jgi:predicted anti-sigma-YlaC factor YlaD